MRSTKSAIRYAKAILELSSETNSVDQVASDMERIIVAGNQTPDFQIFLNSRKMRRIRRAFFKCYLLMRPQAALVFLDFWRAAQPLRRVHVS